MHCLLRYDRNSIDLELPGDVGIRIEGDRYPPPLTDPVGEIRHALEAPR